jgi:hypothetical protein
LILTLEKENARYVRHVFRALMVHITKSEVYAAYAHYILTERDTFSIFSFRFSLYGIYKTIILPVVLYGCKIWSLTLREVQRLQVFENRVLRRICGPKRDEVTGEWRKLHNEELRNSYSSQV